MPSASPLLLATLALAYGAEATSVPPPTLGARLEGGLDIGPRGPGPAAAVGIHAGVPMSEGVTVEVEALLGADDAPAPRGAGLGGVRVGLGGGLSLSAAGGGGWRADGPTPLGRFGVAWDVSLRSGAVLRLSALGEAASKGGAALLGVGYHFPLEQRGRVTTVAVVAPPEPPPPAPVPSPPKAPPPFQVEPANALVWIPHPVCAWVPAAEAAALLAVADPTLPIQVRAPGYLPVVVPRNGTTRVKLEPAPPTGSVVVVAYPGDDVRIADAAFPLSPDGTVIFGAPEGALEVTVTGAGRTVVLEGAVASGYALWLRAPEPSPLVVRFPAGDAEVPPEALGAIRAFAEAAGGYGFRVVGSWSGETPLAETRRLAARRAEALADALVAAGLPADKVDVLSTSSPREGAPAEDLRSARVEPILPKEVR